jgi:hypothetical protein
MFTLSCLPAFVPLYNMRTESIVMVAEQCMHFGIVERFYVAFNINVFMSSCKVPDVFVIF